MLVWMVLAATAWAADWQAVDDRARTTTRVGAALSGGAALWIAGQAFGRPEVTFAGGLLERASLPVAAAGAMRSRHALQAQGADIPSTGGALAYSLYGVGTAMQVVGVPLFAVALQRQPEDDLGRGALTGAGLYVLGGMTRLAGWGGVAALTVGATQHRKRELVARVDSRRPVRWGIGPMAGRRGMVVNVHGW